MKKWLCFILIIALAMTAFDSVALADDGGDSEANGTYDPFSPENENNGVPSDERHVYETQAKYGLRAYALGANSDPRYINVLLSQADASQQSHTLAKVWFTGNYALCDDSDAAVFKVASDHQYTIAVNGTSLELRDTNGTVLYTGAGFYFKEYAPPTGLSYNYFKVEKVTNGETASDRIYRGELNCYYLTNTGLYSASRLWTGIYLVNRVYIEDYLKGVLSAEIGAKSAAAQEAQAIVARNFAVKSKRTDGRVFDVYDYNISQVYFGIYSVAGTDEAVDNTAGKVLSYDGSVISAYYGNTNGGFTETSSNQWSGEGKSGPESVREDIYDLLASAYVEEVTIPAVTSGSDTYSASLVANALVPALSATYTGITAADITITGISIAQGACYVKNADGTYSAATSPCSHHDGTDQTQICSHFCSIDVTFSGVTVSGTDIGAYTVNLKDIDFYKSPENGRPLGFFTNAALERYWLFTNYDTNGTNVVSYTIRHARNGSGVGLSQQGAIQRAKAGQTAAQILEFYYPSCTVGAYTALSAGRDTLGDISQVTFAQDIRVLGSDAYVYAMSNTNSLIRGVAKAGSSIKVNKISSSGTWAQIEYSGITGYVKVGQFSVAFTKIRISNINDYIYIRPAIGSSENIGKAYPGEVYELVEANTSGSCYHKIKYGSTEGYISGRYSTLLTASAAGDDNGIATYTVSVTPPSGYSDTVLWVDGIAYEGTLSGTTLSATIYTDAATNAVMYYYNASATPKGMSVWLLSYSNGSYTAKLVPGFNDLLLYHGFSARIRGESGIRFKSSIAEGTRNTLLTDGIEGYKLVEYGTVSFHFPQYYGSYAFIKCDDGTLPTGYGKSYFTSKGTLYDFITETVDGRIRFASVRTGLMQEDYDTVYPFRAYITLSNATQTLNIYGPPMSRDVYTIAKYYMDRQDYTNDSEEGIYLNAIINYVESQTD